MSPLRRYTARQAGDTDGLDVQRQGGTNEADFRGILDDFVDRGQEVSHYRGEN
jgi:hypothetical protein